MSSSRFGASETVSVLATDTSFTPTTPDSPFVVRVVSDVPFHVAWNREATTEDAFIPAECVEHFSVGVNDVIHFVRASGAADGTAWVTISARS